MIRASFARFSIGALPLLFASVGAFAQDEDDKPFDRTPVDCVRVTSIDKTEAVDDQNILFHMRGDAVYRNHLPQRCPRLEQEDRIAYRVFGGRLCSSDTITVVEQGVFGLQPGFTCGLGDFVPLSPEEVEDLRAQEDDLPAGVDAIQAEAVDLEKNGEPAADPEPGERSDAPAADE
ncbi:MAG TPA: hypothetical protein VIQ99_09910 [Gammaproteobacteria bacterium]